MLPTQVPPQAIHAWRPITHQYDEVIDWLDDHMDLDFITTYEHANDPRQVFFEDGSWVYGNARGCVKGMYCDTDGEFDLDAIRCDFITTGINTELNDDTWQMEQNCYTSNGEWLITLALGGESEDLGEFEFLIRYWRGEYVLYIPVMFK